MPRHASSRTKYSGADLSFMLQHRPECRDPSILPTRRARRRLMIVAALTRRSNAHQEESYEIECLRITRSAALPRRVTLTAPDASTCLMVSVTGIAGTAARLAAAASIARVISARVTNRQAAFIRSARCPVRHCPMPRGRHKQRLRAGGPAIRQLAMVDPATA